MAKKHVFEYTSIQPIQKSNSTSFMLNNNFYEMNIKKVGHRGGLGEGIVLISSWNSNCQYLLGYPSILLGYLSYIHTCIPSIGS